MKTAVGAGPALVALSTIATPALAQIPVPEPDPKGIEVGARAGFAHALGDRVEGQRFDNTVDRAWLLVLDVGYRLTPHLYLGGLLSYARLDVDKGNLGCGTEFIDGPGDCSGSALRIAAEAQWRWSKRWLATWIAAGFGAERFQIDYASGCMDGPFSQTDTGFEFGHLEIGLGVRPDWGVVVGPFASYSFGMFRNSVFKGSCRGPPGDDIPNKAIHGMATGGLRVMYTVR
jgi:hypothetical protein